MAAVDMFLKLDGIDGESTKSKNEGWIEISSFSFGAANASTGALGGGHGAGKVAMSSLSFHKTVDKATPLLFLHCCNGKHIAKAQFQVKESTGGNTTETYMQYDLESVYVDGVTWGASETELNKLVPGQTGTMAKITQIEKPTEQLSLSFQKITISYWPQDKAGKLGAKIPAGWDLSANAKI